MKLFVRITDAEATQEGKAFMLFDEDGNVLPGQVAVAVRQSCNERTTVTVEFGVDGDNVVLELP